MHQAIDVICDASVVLKWFHSAGEEEVGASRALLDLHRARTLAIAVLDLTAYEVANALLRGAGVPAPQVQVVLDALDLVCPRLTLTPAELARAVALAATHNLTVYEAAYASAAAAHGAELATLDRAILAAGLGRRPSEMVGERG